MRQAAEVMRAAAPDWRSEADHYIAEGDLVVEHFHASGTRTGELFGAPADGKPSPCAASTSSASRTTRSSNGGVA